MRIFIALGGLLVTLLLAVLIAPYFVDWTAFRDEFEREAGRILGRPVTVEGSASARLLPFPSLTFEDVVVEGEGGPPLITLASFSMDAELAPYLSGEIRIFQMRLESPHLTVPLSADGMARGEAAAGLPDSTVILENVDISDGRITFLDAAGAPRHEISAIEGSLSARTLSGPFSGGGTLVADGEPLSFSLSSGAIAEDGAWPLRLGLSSERLAAAFAFDGTTQLGDGAADFAGSLQITSPFAEEAPDRPLPPIRVVSSIEISEQAAELFEARVEVGDAEAPYVLTGSGRVAFAPEPRYELDLSGEQVDVDRIAGEGLAEGEPITFADRAEAVRQTLAAIPILGMAGEVDLRLPVVTAGDTTIRNSIFSGSQTEGGWQIRELSAELPGRTLLEASGEVIVGETLGFTGDLLVASRQVGGFANWMSGRVDPHLAPLQRGGFAATVNLSRERQIFEDLEVDVGGQRLFGRLERTAAGETRSIGADLSGEAVDLDAFIAFARLFGEEASGGLTAAETLDVRFDAGPASFQGLSAGRFGVDFAYAGGALDLRNLVVGDLAGANVEARGTVEGLPADPRPEIAFDVAAEDPAGILRLLDQRLSESPVVDLLSERAGQLGPLRLSGTAALPIEDGAPALTVRVQGEAAGTAVALGLSLENGLAAATTNGRFGFEASLSNEDPLVLAGQLGLRGFDLGAPAPLAVSLALSGEAGEPASASARVSAPGSSLSADGTVDLSAAGIDSAELAVRAESTDAAPWLTLAGLALGQGFDPVPADLSAQLSWFKGDWTLNGIEGDVAGRRLRAALRATAEGGVVGDAELSALSLPWLATLVYGGDPTIGGEVAWPEQPFGSTLVNSRPLLLDLSAARLELGEERAVEDFAAEVRSGEGYIGARNISGRLGGGALSGMMRLSNSGGLGSLAADLRLEGAQLGDPQAPAEGNLDGKISAEGSGRSYAELVRSLTGSGEMRLADASLGGIAPSIFPDILRSTSGEDFEVDADAVREVVGSLALGRRYPVPQLAAPVELTLGEISFAQRPIAESERERLVAQGSVDLLNLTAEASATLSFLPEEDERFPETEPAVTYRMAGPIGVPFELASVENLVGYLTVRKLRREEERLEAIREDLRETLRLRREARFFNWRQAERERLAAEAAEAARVQAEEEERARAAAAEARRQAEEQAAAEAAARLAAERAAAAAAEAPPVTPPAAPAPPSASPPLDFDLSPPEPSTPAESVNPPQGYEGLPGVEPPIDF